MLCTTTVCTATPLPRVSRRSPPWLAGRLAGPAPQISRNMGVGAKSRFRGMRERHPEYRFRGIGRGTQNPEITGYQGSPTESAKSTLFNFPNFYDARCCQNSLKPQRSTAGGIQKNAPSSWGPSVVFWEAERRPKNHRGAPAGILLLTRTNARAAKEDRK